MESKDIRFVEKKVDESWKDTASKEKNVLDAKASASAASSESVKTSKPFLDLLTSLAYQGMLHLGEMPHPQTGKLSVNLAAAREVLDLLSAIKLKTEGHASLEEKEVLDSVLPELQMKFSQKI